MQNPETTELSERELEILKLVATGASNKEIARILFISSNTVKVHLRNIFSKINTASRTEAAMYAVRIGLVVHAPSQIASEASDETLSNGNIKNQASEAIPIAGAVVQPASNRILRIAPYILIIGLIGLIFLGLRLSPSLALFAPPTSTSPPPRLTPTPIPHWKNIARLPSARSDPALVAFGDQIYAIGGVDSQGAYGGLDRYDPQSNNWISLSPKPLPVFNAQAAVISGLIFVPGGRTSLENKQPTNLLEIYDTNTGRWSKGASLPIPLSGYGLAAYDGDLYLFGGWDGQNYRNTVYMYNPTTDTWEQRTPMPTARAFCGVAEAGGRIFVIGGMNGDQSVDVNEIYSPTRDTINNNPWASGFPIPESRFGIRAANIADTIYVFSDESQYDNRVGLIYFPQSNTWQSLETSPFPLGDYFGMTSIGTDLYFIGGLFDTTFSNQNISYRAIITLSIPIIIK